MDFDFHGSFQWTGGHREIGTIIEQRGRLLFLNPKCCGQLVNADAFK
jgi:hypothetical protein